MQCNGNNDLSLYRPASARPHSLKGSMKRVFFVFVFWMVAPFSYLTNVAIGLVQ